MRNNMVLMGLKEDNKESYTETENKVKRFMKEELNMMSEQVTEVRFERVHCFGKQTMGKPRPIVAKFTHYKTKVAVLERGRELHKRPIPCRNHGKEKKALSNNA